ncbi:MULTISPECIES: serine hydrolase [Streptosporangium]|uniref:Beta-lactamase class A n=1 Tax=Streptosporangium brasiliense TaxID=47480 RepID=A0ABT9R1E0_9ACTN|nr:serine hydrolase [Streptosporangium brasiliense]MDP9862716.1 beta-lactamase class A [Streptosporangium brasiliense]
MSDLGALFRAAGVTGYLHAVDVDTGAEVTHGADEPVVLASVFKVALLVEFFRQADAGRLEPSERVTVMADGHTPGPTGVSVMADDVTISLRDLAYLMMAVSDNTAADTLIRRVGLPAVNAMLAAAGLDGTWVEHDCRGLFASIVEDTGQEEMPTDPAVIARLRALDPARTSRSTPRDMTRLLSMIWRDEAASAESCASMRGLLGLQVWPHRLAAGFPYDDVAVSGKTGTLPTIRNEVGVVEYPDGGCYAVAVFTRSYGTAQNQPRADAVIGTAARAAVERLRD